MIKYYNQEKIERYKIKKGENRQRRMRVGLIVQGYINILSEIENSLESLINEYLLNNISNNDLSSNAEIIKKISLAFALKRGLFIVFLHLPLRLNSLN